tara:strand:+ start:476 stop:1084 length:609 start_codon:yes stop_codon:yes gene_type:complete
MKSILIASLISTYFFTTADPQEVLHAQYKAYVNVQAFRPSAVEKYRNRLLDKTKKLPKSAQKFLDTNVDWEIYAESIFKPNWDKLTKKQKAKFKKLLQRDAINRYGHLFSPSMKFSVKFNGETEYKTLRENKFAKVSTTLSSISSDAEVDIDFIFHRLPERWALCDVYIDGVSKSKSYRKSVRRIYKKEGYEGVISAFQKNN